VIPAAIKKLANNPVFLKDSGKVCTSGL
jgi:hypothetical protein